MNRELSASVFGFILFLGPEIQLAHGPTSLAKGSVLTVDEDEIVIVTPAGSAVAIRVGEGTRFRYENGAPARRKDLRAGDRVAIQVDSIGGSHLAEEGRFATPRGEKS